MSLVCAQKLIVFAVLFLLCFTKNLGAEKTKAEKIWAGMTKQELFAVYAQKDERTYRFNDHELWITFNEKTSTGVCPMVTFYLVDDKLVSWRVNDRSEIVTEYLTEFSAQIFNKAHPTLHKALRDVLERLPADVFCMLTDRANPVLFIEYYTQGVGRFANSADIIFLKDDPPTFTRGIRIVKLSTELDRTRNIKAIEGVIAHELAHRFLGHAGEKSNYSGELEKKANDLVRQWGFAEELKEAQKRFKS